VTDYEHCCKVGRVADKHDLTTPVLDQDINEELVAKWKGKSDHPETALRPLAKWFNYKCLKSIYIEHGRAATETKLEMEFEALTGDDEDRRWWIEEELEGNGIDPDEPRSDFISSSTLHRHLTNCLGETKTKPETDTDWEREKTEYARDTAAKQIEEALRSLENKGILPDATEATVSVSIHLDCPECSTSVPIRRARQRGYICEEHMDTREELDKEPNAKM